MRTWHGLALVACVSLLGCGRPRVCEAPPQTTFVSSSPAGPLFSAPPRPASTPPRSFELEVDPKNNIFIQDVLDSVRHGVGPYHVLAISAGGQWGAYGAGVLAGLSAGEGVPEFGLVTGISTGAMLAPLIFLGEYKVAKDLYTNLSDEDVFHPRSPISLLWANSVLDNAPLRQKVDAMLTSERIAKIRRANIDQHRVLAVQAVNLDAGTSVVFDLTAIAAETYKPCGDVSPRDCIAQAIVAAAAIPVAFPPEFIGGEMYVDGGLRQHAFSFKLVQEAVHRPMALEQKMSLLPPTEKLLKLGGEPEPRTRTIELLLIANTDFVVTPQCVRNGFLDIAARSAGVAIDQISIGSFYRVMAETLENGDQARFTYADPGLNDCKRAIASAPGGLADAFDKPYMRCLFKAGCTLAAAGSRQMWHYDPDDLPQSPAVSVSRKQLIAVPSPPAICNVPD